MTFIQATSVDNLKPLIEINQKIFDDPEKENRLYKDFKNGLFQVYYLLRDGFTGVSTSSSSIQAYALTFFTYSTWQHRVLAIGEFWHDPDLNDARRLDVLTRFRDELFAEARKHKCKRVNYNMSVNSKKLVDGFEQLGMRDLTKEENWDIFEMGTNELDEFVRDVPDVDETKYKIVKVEDMSRYAGQIRQCIYELAVFENLQDQFECNVTGTEI